MKDLGGYTKVLNDSVKSIMEQLASNPRAAPVLEFALRSLQSQVPQMRAQAQSLLGRIKLHTTASGMSTHASRRDKLGPGTYLELELRAPQIGWRGTADLVNLSASGCEIMDFKTGARDEKHRFQIRVYALLWSRDVERNPSSSPADKLTLAYENAIVTVDCPSPAELNSLESELARRRDVAMQALNARPPEARPSADNCRYCPVRQLCEDYWQAQRLGTPAWGGARAPFMDLEVSVLARHGSLSWDAMVRASRGVLTGSPILLRLATPGLDLRVGDRIRVLDAHVSEIPEEESRPAVATLHATSEVFLVHRAAWS